MESDKHLAVPLSKIELAKIGWFEKGVGGSDLYPIGQTIKEHLDRSNWKSRIERRLNAEDISCSIMTAKDRNSFKMQIVEGPEFGNKPLEISEIKKETYELDLSLEGLEKLPFGERNQHELYVIPHLQLARKMDNRLVKITANGGILFEEEIDLKEAMNYMHQLIDLETVICQITKECLPKDLDFGKIKYWGYIPGIISSDAEFVGYVENISRKKRLLGGYKYIFSDTGSEIAEKRVIDKMDYWYSCFIEDKRLSGQKLHPTIPCKHCIIAYGRPT